MMQLAVMKTLQMVTAQRLRTTLTMTLISWSMISILSNPLKSTWLVSNLQHMPKQSELSPPAYTQHTLISAMPGLKHWCHSGTNA